MLPVVPRSLLPESDHASSLLAISPPPSLGKLSTPVLYENLVPPIQEKTMYREDSYPSAVCTPFYHQLTRLNTSIFQPVTLPRTYKDSEGRKQQRGLKDLPDWLRENFRKLFIRRIIEQVCLGDVPWHNPTLSSLQRDFNQVYPAHRIRLHSDDTAVIPVSYG